MKRTNRKKKHNPIPVRYPSLVTQLNSFIPFENALNKLIETGEANCDDDGTLVFKDGAGVTQSFTSSIKVYIEIITLYCKQNNIVYDTHPLTILQNRMFEGIGFDEDEIDKARKCLNDCKQLVMRIKPSVLLSYLNTVKISIAFEKNSECSLKDPELYLFSLKHKAGDLTYDEVYERSKKYNELSKNNPNNERILMLKNFYTEFLVAYIFQRKNQRSSIVNERVSNGCSE